MEIRQIGDRRSAPFKVRVVKIGIAEVPGLGRRALPSGRSDAGGIIELRAT
jgi:hypothetical protein